VFFSSKAFTFAAALFICCVMTYTN
jgi:hypothetical protein